MMFVVAGVWLLLALGLAYSISYLSNLRKFLRIAMFMIPGSFIAGVLILVWAISGK
ncbi:MAG: hypothetical protein L6Q81_15695 [Bacteroidia bacterium]|nr:hypothetical protein [Bacteroidia bacterium]